MIIVPDNWYPLVCKQFILIFAYRYARLGFIYSICSPFGCWENRRKSEECGITNRNFALARCCKDEVNSRLVCDAWFPNNRRSKISCLNFVPSFQNFLESQTLECMFYNFSSNSKSCPNNLLTLGIVAHIWLVYFFLFSQISAFIKSSRVINS